MREGAQYFYLFTGIGSNGKSLLFNFLLDCFGEYGTTLESETLTYVKVRANEHCDDMAKLPGCRIALVKEFLEDSTINCKTIKGFTGDDDISTREIYKKQFTFRPQAHLGVICNELPKFSDSSDAMNRRNIVIHFPFRFCIKPEDDPTEFGPNDRKIDNKLSVLLKQEKYMIAFIQILSKVYIENYTNELAISNIPVSIKESTTSYNKDNDLIGGWCNENYEKDPKADKIKASDLREQFMADTETRISAIKFNNNMKSKMGLIPLKFKDGYYFQGIRRKVIENSDKNDLEYQLGGCSSNSE